MKMGILYIVATPIGNLKDITLRGLEVLTSVDGIACEDTRRTGNLLNQFHPPTSGSNVKFPISNEIIKRPRLISYYEQNEFKRIPEIITALKNGLSIALVSDAGTPAISDPGFKLVRECIKEGIKVESIPGPSSVISALVVSGLPTDKFLFLGYLPKKTGNRMTLLETVKSSLKLNEKFHPTVILFEAPHRLSQFLEELQVVFGDIEIVIARELTKIHEEIIRTSVSQAVSHFKEKEPKGEFVILFNLYNSILY